MADTKETEKGIVRANPSRQQPNSTARFWAYARHWQLLPTLANRTGYVA